MTDTSVATGRAVAADSELLKAAGGGRANGQPAGKTMPAVVIGHDRSGSALVQTAEGRLTLPSASALAAGTRLTVFVRADGSAREVAARPPEAGVPAQTRGGTDFVRLGVLPAGSPRAQELPPGTLLRAEIVQRFPPQSADPAAAGEGPGKGLLKGETVILRVLPADPRKQGEASRSPSPQNIIARVVDAGPRATLSSVLGPLQVAAGDGPEDAGPLTLRVLEKILPRADDGAGATARPLAASGQPPMFGKAWPMTALLLKTLDTLDPAMATLVRQDLPRPGEELAGRILRFMLQLGDEAPDVARLYPSLSGQPEAKPFLERLGDDLQRYVRLTEPGNDWRTFVIPVADGKDLVPFHFYVRDDSGRDMADAAETGVRFLVDIDMSRLGAFQLDGFYRRRQLSLAIRSRSRLPHVLGDRLKEIFERALMGGGMTGELRLESEGEFNREPFGTLSGKQASLAI